MAEAPISVEIFCSYALADEAWRQKLETHLSPLKQQGLISLWHDQLILPGTTWAQAIDQHLETASVILLLVSADFLASDYCYSVEMKRALERQEAGEAQVIPILVRPVDWKYAPFAHLQALPTDAKPLATWRNQDRALTDVAASIRRVIVEELPLLAAKVPRAALPAIWNIPYPRNPFFIGREDLLSRLHTQLQAGQPTALSQHRQAISGLGGIGKTQIAVEYAYRFGQEYQAVLWAQAESRETLVSSYVTFAAMLNLPKQNTQERATTVQAVKRWLQTQSKWLLILDNADELALVPEFLPPALGGHLLLTTRALAMAHLANRIEVETFSAEQGALFLLRRAVLLARDASLEQAAVEDRERAVQITKALGGLPLALDQAGAYLEETGCSLLEYQQFYQQHRAVLLGERRGLEDDHPPVATTWSLSFQKVERVNPAATDLLRLCAYLAPDAIPEEILTADASRLGPVLAPVAANAFLLNQAIESLRAYSLIRRDPKGKTLSIHRLVQAVLQDTMDEEEKHTWIERAMLAVNAAFPHVEYLQVELGTWPQHERLLSHALLAAQFIEEYQISSSEAGNLLYQTAWYLRVHGRYQEAERLYLRALPIQEQTLGKGHPDVGTSHCGLGVLYDEQSNYAEAEENYRCALHILEQALGAEHREITYTLNGLANLYRKQRRYAEAEPLYQRALHIREQALGPEHSEVAYPLNGLANLYREQGRYAEAEPLYQRALHIFEQQLGPKHPETAEIIYDLARFREAQDNGEEASVCYARALAVREQALGAQHPKTRETRTRFIALLHAMGRHEEAAQHEAAQSEP